MSTSVTTPFRTTPRFPRLGFFAAALLSVAAGFGCTSDNPEFDKPCSPGDRLCAGSDAAGRALSQVCGRDPADRPVLIDEACPVSATCTDGFCMRPATAASCQRQADCAAGLACAPLVQTPDPGATSLALTSVCLPVQPSSAAASGAPCQADADCRSYRCLQHPSGRYCLDACSTDSDCARPKTCKSFNVTFFGVMGSIRSCS